MRRDATSEENVSDFAFRFDSAIPAIVFGGDVELSGWFVDLRGRPLHGIRAVIERPLFGRRVIRARRKRNRPEVAAAYPHLSDAGSSGFFLQLRFPLGRCQLTLQVQDHEKVWRTFHRAKVRSFPLSFLERTGLRRTHRHVTRRLQRSFQSTQPALRESVVPSLPESGARRTQRVVVLATSKSNLFILEIGDLITAGFAALGCVAELHLDEPPTAEAPAETLQIVLTPHEYYNLYLTETTSRARARELSHDLILLSTEQPETGWFHSNLQWAASARAFADIHALGVLAYRARGLRCHHLQLGYHPLLGPAQRIPHAERPNDIVFLGSLTERRNRFFARHAEFFSRHHCHLRFVPLDFAKTKETRSYLTTQRRNELLSRSKILLNVHYSEQQYFEWHRMLVALANGCCVITETCSGHGPLVPGKHFVMVEPEDLIPCCEYYLHHPAECAQIAEAAFAFLSMELRQEQTCAAFLREVEAAEAPLVAQPEVGGDAPPVPLPPELRTILRRHDTRLFRQALRKDVAGMTEAARSVFRRGQATTLSAVETEEEIRRNVVHKREGFRERLKAQTQAGEHGAVVPHDNVAYTNYPAPALSVVVTLYNYARFIEECVASIEAATRQLRQPVEVLIVNDASTDRSLATALGCQQQHDLPIRVVDKRFNTGLADARNVGIRLARAPFVFILDADNLVFPQAFAQLLPAIKEKNAVAAFSLLCRFRGTPADRVGLLSYYDWDPQILVQYPYIDAMAMFRREALLAGGGYDNTLNQIGWFGWEDYEMWLRFAHEKQKVAFVPNILCLYRHHETSMINTTNLFEAELVQHLITRYGELLDNFEPRATIFGVDRQHIAR